MSNNTIATKQHHNSSRTVVGTSAFRSISTMFGKGIHRAAKLSSRNPIEMIAGILILSSFSYFYLFNLARNTSDIFFTGTVTRLYPTFVYSSSPYQNDFAQLTRNQVPSLTNQQPTVKIQLKQISITDQEKSIINKDTINSILRFQNTIHHTLLDDSIGQFGYNSLCYQDAQGECFTTSLSSLFSQEQVTTEDELYQAIHKNPELAIALFGGVNTTEQDSNTVLLSFAFNASTAYRQQLSHLWEQKVASLTTKNGDLVSLSSTAASASTSSGEQDVFTWMFIITRNIVYRIKELIEVCVTLFSLYFNKALNFILLT